MTLSQLINTFPVGNVVDGSNMTFSDYKVWEWDLQKKLCYFELNHPEYGMNRFIKTLEENNINWTLEDMQQIDVLQLDLKSVLALMVGMFCIEKYDIDNQYKLFQNKNMIQCIKRLQQLNN